MSDRLAHVLMPGDVACAERGERLETLLGSCIAIILTDRRRTIGAMCHIVHTRPDPLPHPPPYPAADAAIAALYGLLMQRGFVPELCDAYLYGGGNMFPQLVDGPHVGAANGEWVRARLAKDGIRVVLEDLGGAAYRKVVWTVGGESPQVTAAAV